MKLLSVAAALVATQALMQNPSPVAPTAIPATGTFSSDGVTLTVAGGVAFTGRSAFDRDMPVILVAVTNVALYPDAIAAFVDRKRAIELLVRDDQTPVVYLEFTAEGRWRGVSYYFGPGTGCGYCTSEVASTVAIRSGRLTGNLKGTESTRPFDITLDLEVLGDDHGTPLPAGGGDPGRAYRAYHSAVAQRDGAAVKPTLSPGNLEVFERASKNDDLIGFLGYLADKNPTENLKIVRGWANTKKASLLIEGENSFGRVVGEVFLLNVGGVWTVDEVLTETEVG